MRVDSMYVYMSEYLIISMSICVIREREREPNMLITHKRRNKIVTGPLHIVTVCVCMYEYVTIVYMYVCHNAKLLILYDFKTQWPVSIP